MQNSNTYPRSLIYSEILWLREEELCRYPIDSRLGRLAQGVVQDHNGRQVAKWAQYSDRRFRSFKDSGYVWIVRTK